MLGRTLTVAAACTGVVFLSICVGFLFEAIELQDKEMEIKDNHMKILAMIEYRNFSAIIIQRWYKKCKGKNLLAQRGSMFAMDQLISGNFSEAKSTIQEQMMIANKQSIGQIARETHKFVEKLDQNIEEILAKVRRLTAERDKAVSAINYVKVEPFDTDVSGKYNDTMNSE